MQAIRLHVIELSTIRSKMKTRGRLVLSVIVIAWMNATLLPCAMAMEMSPNEPVSITASGEHDGHQGHQGHSADSEDRSEHACPHCPSSASHDTNACAVTAANECDISPDVKPGERILKVDLNDMFDNAHSSYRNCALDRAPLQLVAVPSNCKKPTFIVGPSISIRNCVFLK